MTQPQYHLEGIVRTRSEGMEDFEGPLDVIFLLLSKNKIEIQDVSITAILEQYLAYLDEMKRLDMEIARYCSRIAVMLTFCISILFLLSNRKITSRGPSKSSISSDLDRTTPSSLYFGSVMEPPGNYE